MREIVITLTDEEYVRLARLVSSINDKDAHWRFRGGLLPDPYSVDEFAAYLIRVSLRVLPVDEPIALPGQLATTG